MGSFNAICALSGLPILPGDPVKLLFLTSSPYRNNNCCYNNDKMFVRTIPISGFYDDYGRIEYEKNHLTQLICDVFKQDIIYQPMGKNQYHEHALDSSFVFADLLNSALQGKLFVKDGYSLRSKSPKEVKKLDKRIPTGTRVQKILEKNNLPIAKNDKKLGFTAIPLKRGFVEVYFESSNYKLDKEEQLKTLIPLISKKYNTKIIYTVVSEQNTHPRLLVFPKDVSILNNFDSKMNEITSNESFKPFSRRALQVNSVLIREDVWNAYLNLNYGNYVLKPQELVDKFHNEVANKIKDELPENLSIKYTMSDLFRYCNIIPFQTMIDVHFKEAYKNENLTPEQKDEVLFLVGEVAYVEFIMNCINQMWNISAIGNQSPAWNVYEQLSNSFSNIIASEQKKEKQQEFEDLQHEDCII